MGMKTRSMSKTPPFFSDVEESDDNSLTSGATTTIETTNYTDDEQDEAQDDEQDDDFYYEEYQSDAKKCSSNSEDPSPFRHAQPRRVVLNLLRTIRKSGGYQMTPIRARVGVCFLCNQMKTLSQRITFGDQSMDCGRHCAQRIVLACPKQLQRL